jgi:hypothetical protein
MAHDILISYSHSDKASADAACAILESEGLRCWIAPRDILPGSEWTESIMDALGGAKALVLLFSRHADASAQVRREVERAVHHAIPIVPVRLEEVIPGRAMEYLISTPHWLDAVSPPLEAHYRRLAANLKLLISQHERPADSSERPIEPNQAPRQLTPTAPRRPTMLILAAVGAVLVLALIYGGWRHFSASANLRAAAPSPQPLAPQPIVPSPQPQPLPQPAPTTQPPTTAPAHSSEPTPVLPAPDSTPRKTAADLIGTWTDRVNNVNFRSDFRSDGTMTAIWSDAATGTIIYNGIGRYTYDGKLLTYFFPGAIQQGKTTWVDAEHVYYRTVTSTVPGAVGTETVMTREK